MDYLAQFGAAEKPKAQAPKAFSQPTPTTSLPNYAQIAPKFYSFTSAPQPTLDNRSKIETSMNSKELPDDPSISKINRTLNLSLEVPQNDRSSTFEKLHSQNRDIQDPVLKKIYQKKDSVAVDFGAREKIEHIASKHDKATSVSNKMADREPEPLVLENEELKEKSNPKAKEETAVQKREKK